MSAVTKLLTQLTVRHLLTAAGADGMHTLIGVIAKSGLSFHSYSLGSRYVCGAHCESSTIPISPLWDQQRPSILFQVHVYNIYINI